MIRKKHLRNVTGHIPMYVNVQTYMCMCMQWARVQLLPSLSHLPGMVKIGTPPKKLLNLSESMVADVTISLRSRLCKWTHTRMMS